MTIQDIETSIKPVTSVIIITPEIAKRWLNRNILNRRVDATTVEKYKRDMQAGVWHFTNAGIAFDINGEMIDGQHRLLAISQLEEGFAIGMNVTRGLPAEARFFIDQGRKRTAGSQLAIAGHKNSNETAAAAKLFLTWQSGILFRDRRHASLITAPQVQEWVAKHPELVELANQNHKNIIRNDAQQSAARAAFYGFASIDPAQAAMFFSKLSSGAGLDNGHPILALRQRLETDRRNRTKRTQREQLGMLVTAWNAWRKSRSLKIIAAKPWTEATFPTPV